MASRALPRLALCALALGLASAACTGKVGKASTKCPITNKALYENGAVCGMDFDTSIQQAAYIWDLPRVKCLVEKEKVSVNQADKVGNTPLTQAFLAADIVYWHPDKPEQDAMIAYLLSKGANPNAPLGGSGGYSGVNGYQPIHWAAYDGRADLVSALLAAGASANARDSRSRTPMMQAAKCDFRLSSDAGADRTINLLASRGGDVLAKSKAGETALSLMTLPPAAEMGKPTWPTGSCRSTYYTIKSLMAKAQAKGTGRKLATAA